MNNEPVAWIDLYDLERLPHYDCYIGSQKIKNGIPLYTHPVKELTDEKCFCSRCGKRLGSGIHTCTPPADILRKAQEK